MIELSTGRVACGCDVDAHSPRLVVLTGGPGAGKTEIMKLASHSFCHHVAILPEAVDLVLGAGFPHLQRQLEEMAREDPRFAVVVCSQGTLGGLAYWPRSPKSYFDRVGTTHGSELERYSTVIHLRSPGDSLGYQRSENRLETAEQAGAIDERIVEIWSDHPQVFEVPSKGDFLEKAEEALALIRAQLPLCCDGVP